MFPTFISILDIQSWWEVPSIAHFCSLFRTAFNLLDFDIEDLEEALLADGTEETSWLQELIVRLLSGCLPNNEISTFNYQMFLRRLFRQKCQEHDRYNPFNTDIDFTLLPLKTKVDILHALCDFRLDADDVLDQLKNLEADSLRVEPLGFDSNESAYWYFYGTRLYREDFKTKNNKKKSIWQVICFSEDDWFQLTKKFKNSSEKTEKNLYYTLSKNFLPELPRLFKEKERQARRRLLENQPRRTSSRLRKIEYPEKPDTIDCDDNMARTKQRRPVTAPRKSENDTSLNKTKKKKSDKNDQASSKPAPVGRQTNNSLSAADGQIVIQSVAVTPARRKLKSSQVFRQTEEDIQVGMHKVLDCVRNHEDAWPFADPVEEEYAPNYYTVIRKPMDLQRMEDRLDSGHYRTFGRFKADFQLIVANCQLYNGTDNEYTKMVNNLQKVFDRASEKYLDQISSSEDEIAVEYSDSVKNDVKSRKRKSDSPQRSKKSDSKENHRNISEDREISSKKMKSSGNNVKKEKKSSKNSSSDKEKESSKEKKLKKNKNEIFGTSSSSSKKEKTKNKKSKLKKSHKKLKKRSESPENIRKKRSPTPNCEDEPPPSDDEIPVYHNIPTSPKPRDKHNKLRETIEKLKAKSEMSMKIQNTPDIDNLSLDDLPKENKKEKKKEKHNSNLETSKKHKKSTPSDFDALSIATEQTLKDINKWLDDTPKFTNDFSSASSSPSYVNNLTDDIDMSVVSMETNVKMSDVKQQSRRDVNITKKRSVNRDRSIFNKRREIQRTIDRLQPGKGKGNLISNVSNNSNVVCNEIIISSKKDTKNSLIVHTDTNAPKLSLGTVLDSFGKHKFVDDQKKEDIEKNNVTNMSVEKTTENVEKTEKNESTELTPDETNADGGATPNLSAWFKAFGAPKPILPSTKKPDTKLDEKPEIPRQRRASTGSTVSERSSFSQDCESPKIPPEDRISSPSTTVSPRPEFSPKYGQLRVGFYQDTASGSVKGSPDKGASPRGTSPRALYGADHAYAPDRGNTLGYGGSPCYSHAPGYGGPPPPYIEVTRGVNSVNSVVSVNSPASSRSSPILVSSSQNSPVIITSDVENVTSDVVVQTTTSIVQNNTVTSNVVQNTVQNNVQSTVFPVKKRVYNDDNNIMLSLHETDVNMTTFPHLNVPSTTRHVVAQQQNKIDISKYTNMGYSGPEVNYSRALQQQYSDIDYTRCAQQNNATSLVQQAQNTSQAFKSILNPQNAFGTANNVNNESIQQNEANYSIPALSNIMDRFVTNDMTTSGYYSGVFNKNVPIFSQANMAAMQQYGGMQVVQNQQDFARENQQIQQQSVAQQQNVQEKKSKGRRKSNKTAPPIIDPSPPPQQGFQSYSNLKSTPPTPLDPLKPPTALAGSAFNFAPALDAYPNFLDEFRGPNYRGPPGYPFMAPPGPQVMEPNAGQLYQHYLQAGVLNQGLYPAGYHGLNVRYESMGGGRAPWL